MANKDFYDRIADALQIISGDDSHVDDQNKNMDYYKRIAEALEKISESSGGGSGAGPLIVHIDNDNTLDKTWQEIYDAGGAVMYHSIDEDDYYVMTVTKMTVSEDTYYLYFYNFEISDPITFVSDSADGYPTLYVG